MRHLLVVPIAAAALLLAGCSDDAAPPPPEPSAEAEAPRPEFDPALEPAAAAMVLVPADTTRVAVTDFARLRVDLGVPLLTSSAPQAERDKFWQQVMGRTPALTDGLLRPFEQRLLTDFGFSQDDVDWEARFDGPNGVGYVLRFRAGTPMGRVQAAAREGVGPLANAEVGVLTRLVTLNAAADGAESWAADPDMTSLVGLPAVSTYLEASCIPLTTAFGTDEGVATSTPSDIARLDPLGAFAISFGSELATVRLGEDRPDAFGRLRLSDGLPGTQPAFDAAFEQPVADPETGRLGFDVGDPTAAASLTLQRQLPFAVCAG